MDYHKLKTWPEFYKEIETGNKNFEYRKNDRDFKVGDMLVLEEYDPMTGKYTGNQQRRVIGYILNGGKMGVPEGYCIMSIY